MSEKDPNIQRITLQLDAHRIPINVKREKEPLYRKAAALLNERYKYYLQKTPKASAELLWVYVALEQALNLQNDAREKQIAPMEEKINEMNDKIEQVLNL